jgi:hypothetical protein
MLVAEGDLQVEDLLTVTLEAEMSGLDHTGMNGADRHLVDLFAVDPIEVGDADHGRRAAAVLPGRAAPALRAVKATGSWVLRHDAPLLSDLARRCTCALAIDDVSPNRREAASTLLVVDRREGEQVRSFPLMAEQRGDTPARPWRVDHATTEFPNSSRGISPAVRTFR